MSDEVNKEPQEVSEDLEVIVATGDKAIDIDDFTSKVDEIKRKNAHKAYDKLSINMLTKSGAAVLMLSGVRKENQQELDERVQRDQVKKKNFEEAELKEYIRLKKKFDKKST